jgi:hypothetical protein
LDGVPTKWLHSRVNYAHRTLRNPRKYAHALKELKVGALMNRQNDEFSTLRTYLDEQSPRLDPGALVSLLRAVWQELDGSDEEAMAVHKLERIDDPVWESPHLTFTIERHGGTVLGSSRAEIQRWIVDLDVRSARTEHAGRYRQLRPRGPVVDVVPIADEIASLIATDADDERLEWSRDRQSIRVTTSKWLPHAPAQTTRSRAARLKAALLPKLAELGWQPSRQAGRYERMTRRTDPRA